MTRTPYRLVFPSEELTPSQLKEVIEGQKESLEYLPEDGFVASYVSEEFFLLYQDLIFPICPVTGIVGTWDQDYNSNS